MKANVGGIDKVLRIVVGAGLVGATVAGFVPVWGYVGVIPLVTGLINFCPIYPLLGMSTCSAEKQS